DYIDVMYVSMTKKIMDIAVEIAMAYDKGTVDQDVMDDLLEMISELPERLKKIYWDAYSLFPRPYGPGSFFANAKQDTIRLLFGG
ncbi:MAG: hypothetical protein WCQ53_07275, partial [bacterium]